MIRGRVLGAGGASVGSLRVCISGTNQCAITDQHGWFPALDARPGALRLEVGPAPAEPLLTEAVEVRAGRTSEVILELPRIDAVQASVTVGASEMVAPDGVVTSAVQIQNHPIAKGAGTL